ncbi:MAG: glycosyltransferase [Candidatus Saccharimonadales bacterium]
MSNYSESSYSEDPNSSWNKILSYIKPKTVVLDVGCSSGNFGERLIREKKCVVDGIELDKADYEIAKGKLRHVYNLNIESDDLSGLADKYDYVYFGDVIEHLYTPEQSLRRVQQLLKPDGELLFSIPNMAHTLVRLMLLKGDFKYGETGLLDKTHLHFYTIKEVERVFSASGYRIIRFDPVLKDLPREVVAEELKHVGLDNTPKFMDYLKTTEASIYQIVGAAVKNHSRLTNPREKLALSSPADIFQDYLDKTREYYEDRLKDQNKYIREVEEYAKKTAGELLESMRKIEDLNEKLEKKGMLKTFIHKARQNYPRTIENAKRRAMRSPITSILLPEGSKRRELIVGQMQRFGEGFGNDKTGFLSYANWVNTCEPELFRDTKDLLSSMSRAPLISIVVPFYNTPDKYLYPLLESLRNQLYENWQLCAADGSTDETRAKAIEAACADDDRITYIRLADNNGIVGNTNAGLKYVKGEYTAFMDHDDTLSPYALAEVVIAMSENPDADLFYSDEDKPTDNGSERTTPFFKPGWNPELLLAVNYITHFVVVRTAIVKKVKGLRPGFDGAQDYDFLLRVTERTEKIVHIPKMLYHWRLADGSTAVSAGKKDYATDAGTKALRDAVKRRRLHAEVIQVPDRPTNYRLRYLLPTKEPTVSIIVPFKDKVDYLKTLIPSILVSNYSHYEIILVSNNSSEPETFQYLDSLKRNKRCQVLEWNHKFNYSAVNNFGRSKATGEYVVFLNNDTKVLDPEWLRELVGVASQPQNGAVGPLLLYPDGRIQHAGIVLGMKTMAGHPFRLRWPEEWTDFGLALWPRNYLAVTGACLVVKAEKFDEVGGFDELLTIGGNDVALCLQLYEAGYQNVFWPFTRLTHYENVSVGDYNSSVPIGDYNRSLKYYQPYLNYNDPYFNPNLDLMNEQIGLRGKYE